MDDDQGAGARVEEVAMALVARMHEVADELRRAVDGSAGEGRAAVDGAVEEAAARVLAADDRLFGAGFVSTSGFAGDEGRMSWWQVRGGAARVIARLDSGATGAGDYQRDIDSVEWFHEPVSTGERHLTGPYVDYLCTDDLTLTFTAPISHAGEVIGVIGCDVAGRTFEAALEGALAELKAPAVVVTDESRVVASTDAEELVMRRVTAAGARRFAWRKIPDTPFRFGVAREGASRPGG